MLIGIQQDKFAVKSRMQVAKPHQPVHLLNNGTLELLLNLIQGVVMTVDVTGLSGLMVKIEIVSSGKQAYIVNLGNTGRKELDGSCHHQESWRQN